MKTTDYINALRPLAKTTSIYAVAALLGINEQTVRNWNDGKAHPDEYGCARIAEALDVPIEQVLADVQAERETNPERREYWQSLARKYAACVVAGLVTTTSPSGECSATGQPLLSGATNTRTSSALHTVPIMRHRLRRLLKLLIRGCGRFPGFAS